MKLLYTPLHIINKTSCRLNTKTNHNTFRNSIIHQYKNDEKLELIKSKNVTIVGYGSQGHAHAQNLKDTGVNITVGLRKTSSSWNTVIADGLIVKEMDEAIKSADIVMFLIPDETIADVYNNSVHHQIKYGATIAFAHGFNIHYKLVIPRKDLDVILIAPKAPGNVVRSEYCQGKGVPHLIGIHQNVSITAYETALSYAIANGGGPAGIIETSFREETETDLFGEQAILSGGMIELIKSGFDTLVNNGYSPEVAYFECIHELKMIIDLIHTGGISHMNNTISNNAEFGGCISGKRIINTETKLAMQMCLNDIQSGEYAKKFITEYNNGNPTLKLQRKLIKKHLAEIVGDKIRNLHMQCKKT